MSSRVARYSHSWRREAKLAHAAQRDRRRQAAYRSRSDFLQCMLNSSLHADRWLEQRVRRWEDRLKVGDSVKVLSASPGSFRPSEGCNAPALWVFLTGHFRTFHWAQHGIRSMAKYSSGGCFMLSAVMPDEVCVTNETQLNPKECARPKRTEQESTPSQTAAVTCVLRTPYGTSVHVHPSPPPSQTGFRKTGRRSTTRASPRRSTMSHCSSRAHRKHLVVRWRTLSSNWLERLASTR